MQPQLLELPGALAILSAMITPAVLISACGSLIIATSTRLGRVIDRTRQVSEQFGVLVGEEERTMLEEERELLFHLLQGLTRRARLLQHAMSRLYLAVSILVATSVAIGVVVATAERWAWVPIALGLAGAALLFAASVNLILESRIAMAAVDEEMDFVWRLGQHHAPTDLLERQPGRR
ncbi:MAG TPA: DUF2721 domain-containing protein, partial [Longimicrobiaceae bacterium]|nr:DUF2721 domain-containing protein [Longimicrobiaceae bacterium]